MSIVRTTLTIDPDVAERLRQEISSGRLTLKQVVNDRLRAGFELNPSKKREKFRVHPHASPYVPGVDRLKLNQMVDELDAERFAGRSREGSSR